MPNRKSCSIESYRDSNVYVLLGGPEAGKTTTFELESDFETVSTLPQDIFLRSSTNQALSNKTLFLDGLDELRAGEIDGQRPFDEILEKLEELGNPRLRLSCRNANWFGEKYRVSPGTVSPDGIISVLHINPLSDENVCWPTTRKELLSSACQNQSKEHNQQHKLGLPIHLSSEEILKLAGKKKLI